MTTATFGRSRRRPRDPSGLAVRLCSEFCVPLHPVLSFCFFGVFYLLPLSQAAFCVRHSGFAAPPRSAFCVLAF